MSEYPPISCFTSTYGRTWCLEEAIECFHRQDYPGKKELVILNDYVEQELIYQHPEVTVVNLKKQITPLGKKFATNVNMCSSGILAVWEDDDKFLPWHLRQAVERMKDGIYHSGVAWVWTAPGRLHKSGNHFHGNLVFTRELYDRVGGYHPIDNCTVDVSLMGRFTKEIGPYSQHPVPEDMSYIYVWGCGSYHGSGWGTGIQNVSELAARATEQQRILGKVKTGKIILEPRWSEDYVELARKAARNEGV